MSLIVQANGLTNANLVFVGQRLIIPGSNTSQATAAPAATSISTAQPSASNRYMVARGDTLSGIARRFGTSVAAIAQANGLTNPSLLYVGQQLIIPGSSQAQSPAQTRQHSCVATAKQTTTRYLGPGNNYQADPRPWAAGSQSIVSGRSGSGWIAIPASEGQGGVLWVEASNVTLEGVCNLLPELPPPSTYIQSFTVGVNTVDRGQLARLEAQVPVSWIVVNRPDKTNLVFEQILEDNTSVNVELPRSQPLVPSVGSGRLALVRPLNPNTASIKLRVRLIQLSDNATLDSREASLPIAAAVVPTARPPQNCFAVLRQSTALFAGPGREYGIIAQVYVNNEYPASGRTSNNWLRMDFMGGYAWIESTAATLSGPCDSLPQVPAVGMTIQTFTVSEVSVDAAALMNRTSRLSVTWRVENRAGNANLVFEQIRSDGTSVNIELPRQDQIVPSSGTGAVAPVVPGNTTDTRITLRLRVVSLGDNSTLASREVTVAIQGAITAPTPEYSSLPADQCFDPNQNAPSIGLAKGNTGRGSARIPAEGIPIRSTAPNGSEIGRLKAGDTFSITDGPYCWRFLAGESPRSLSMILHKWRIKTNAVEGWVEEYDSADSTRYYLEKTS
ncbi:MAG: LysM peptidoglycan-binding domain-containing protein [Anaerolineae bacterium]|nr:LysM peptidoglycan-binding domain-containing protein [Anaerolineae bacterium]